MYQLNFHFDVFFYFDHVRMKSCRKFIGYPRLVGSEKRHEWSRKLSVSSCLLFSRIAHLWMACMRFSHECAHLDYSTSFY